MPQDNRIVRLAQQIEALAKKDEPLLLKTTEIAGLRHQGARELHSICAAFVASVNRLLPRPILELAPPEYDPEAFRDPGTNLIQINAQGRIMLITFEATEQLVSTEHFRTPYILEGEIRTYNQEMLERTEIQSRLLFFCMETGRNVWRFFDWRTNRSGVLDLDLLVSLMERIL